MGAARSKAEGNLLEVGMLLIVPVAPLSEPTTAGKVIRCGASSASRLSSSEMRRRTYGSGWLSLENSWGMIHFHGVVGVYVNSLSNMFCTSREYRTISRRSRSVTVTISALFCKRRASMRLSF